MIIVMMIDINGYHDKHHDGELIDFEDMKNLVAGFRSSLTAIYRQNGHSVNIQSLPYMLRDRDRCAEKLQSF